MELYLYRVKVFGPRNTQLFDKPFVPGRVLLAAIREHPTSRVYRGVSWHIGNVEAVDQSSVYFRLGRTSRAVVSQIDASTGNFVEQDFESAPYTHFLLDYDRELVAFMRRVSLAPTADAIASRLLQVLASSRIAHELRCTFSIGPISNPDNFLEALKSAYAIRSFTFSVQRKNPFDVNKDFVDPFERLVEATQARDGNVTVKGPALSEAPLEEIARSAAATGDDARARVQLASGASAVHRSLRGNVATISADELDSVAGRQAAISAARAQHDRIRDHDDST